MHAGMLVRPIEILLVEDSLGDVEMARETLESTKLYNRLSVASDGEEALAFLGRTGKYADAPRPDLVILDLNLPKIDGREVLARIKADNDLKRIPVVVLTISRADEDILKSYNLHANCFITKPIDLNQFMKVVKAIEDFWFSIVTLPPKKAKR